MAGVESGETNNKKLPLAESQPAAKQGNFFEQFTENIQKQVQQFANPLQNEVHTLTDKHGAHADQVKQIAGNGDQEVNQVADNHGPKTFRQQASEATEKIRNEVHQLTDNPAKAIHQHLTRAADSIQHEVKNLAVNPAAEVLGKSFKHSHADAQSQTGNFPEHYKSAKNEGNALNNMGDGNNGSLSVPAPKFFHSPKPAYGASQTEDSQLQSAQAPQASARDEKKSWLAGATGALENLVTSPVGIFGKEVGSHGFGNKSHDTADGGTQPGSTETAGNQSDAPPNFTASSHGDNTNSCQAVDNSLSSSVPKPAKGAGEEKPIGEGKGKSVESATGSPSSATDKKVFDPTAAIGGGALAGTGDSLKGDGKSEQTPAPAKKENGTSDLTTKHGSQDGSSTTQAPAEGGSEAGKTGSPVKDATGAAHSGSDSASQDSKPGSPVTGLGHSPSEGGSEAGKSGGSLAKDGGQDSRPTGSDLKQPEPKSGDTKLPDAPVSAADSKSSQPVESKPSPTESKPVDGSQLSVKKVTDSASDDKGASVAGKTDALPYAKSAGTPTADSSAAKDIIIPAKPISSSLARSSVDAAATVDQALQRLLYAKGGDALASKPEKSPSDLAGARSDNKLSPQDGKGIGDGRVIAAAAGDGRVLGDGRSLADVRSGAGTALDAKQSGDIRTVDGKAGEGRSSESKAGDLRSNADAKPGEGIKDNRVLTPDAQGKGELSPRRQEGPHAGTAGPGIRVDGQAGTGTAAGALANDPRIFGGKGAGEDNTNKNSPIDHVNNNNQPVKSNDAHDGTRKESTTKHAGTDGKVGIDGGLIPLIPIIASAGGNGGSDYTGIAHGGKKVSGQDTKTAKKAGRRKYTVKFGDTLESIAAVMLKDKRYASLLSTINRATLKIINKDGREVVNLLVGQQIWLPSESEMEVHRQAFFVESYSSLNGKANAGNKAANHQAGGLPKQDIAQFVEAIAANALTAGKANVETAAPLGRTWVSVSKITETCQILVADPGDTDTVFSIRLQLRRQGQWVTIAAYESHFGKNVRYVYRQDGSRVSFQMDLPAQIIKSMAREDFASHWRAYEKAFVLNDLKYL